MSNIIYSSKLKSFQDKDTYLAEIPFGIKTKKELLKVYADSLKFPNWFGYNWDAFDDILIDFSWIPFSKIVVYHYDLPNLSEKDLKVFIKILDSNSYLESNEDPDEFYKKHGQKIKKSIIFVFPEKYKDDIEKLLV